MEQDQARIEAQRRADAKNERDTHDLIKDRLLLKERERRNTIKDLFVQNSAFMKSNAVEFFSNPMAMGKFVAFATAIWASYQFSKQSALLFKW